MDRPPACPPTLFFSQGGRALRGSGKKYPSRPHSPATELICLSEIYRPPLAPPVFPEIERVTQEARSFILRHLARLGGGPRLERPLDETVSMCAQLCPDGDYEGVFLATVFFTLQFVNDDLCDGYDVYEVLQANPASQRIAAVLRTIREQPHLLARAMESIIHVIREPTRDQFPEELGEAGREAFLYPAFKEFALRLHSYGQRVGSPHYGSWLHELCESLARFCRSHALIYRNIESISIEEYSQHKLTNCGMHHTLLLMELATRSFLSPEQRQLPLTTDLFHCCCSIGSLLNEVFSYEKEHFRERSGNLVAVIMHKRGCSLRAAVEEVLLLARRHCSALQRLADQARAELSMERDEHQSLRRWVRRMETMAAGCWHWQIAGTTRYQSSTSPFAELRTPC